MADRVSFDVDYGVFRHVDLTKHWREAVAEEENRLTKQNETYLKTAPRMAMCKNLPTAGFKYDWNQFRNHDGLFVVRVRGSIHSNHINNHVKHLNPKEMDTFCAEAFDKASEVLDGLASIGPEDFWAKVAQDLGIQLPAGTAQTRGFWDWAMKLVAARIVGIQEGLPACDAAGDIEMSDQPNKNMSDREPLSLAAQAVDNFLAVGIWKYGDMPKKVTAITRHHVIIAPNKSGPDKPAKKGSAPAKNAPKNTHAHNSHMQVGPTASSKSTIRIRRSEFGSQVGAGQPAWWGFISRLKSLEEISRPRRIPDGSQNHAETAKGGCVQAGAVDDLVIGMHGTTIEGATRTPQVLADLAIRTVNPLKRRHDDTEEAEDSGIGDQPLAKMAKVSQSHAHTSGSPSQVDEPGCGCVKAATDAVLEQCPIAQAYGRVCPDFQCGLKEKEQATERFGLVCLECVEGKPGKKTKKSSRK
ncbi:hypothetical protein INS49_002849 [Diaporthe citri]|uniref:uncharacterized protein n=1 Tax=Diaporthe citri TaxID=83186 RepID=UPI001C807CA0|nr:uncharacterized protein INS49_002849 [Diaporthe citri]KAG6368636.1 hypothetical protein INS49_002849 [Diaporthe citri]